MEVSSILGNTLVFFYDFNITEEVWMILEYYADERDLAEFIRWPIHSDIDTGNWYHGQLVAIQNCLYRNMVASRYVAFHDIDEFIVPHNFTSWTSMVEHVKRPNYFAFSFLSAFFDPHRSEAQQSKIPIISLKALDQSPWSTMRTKCMVKPGWMFEI